MTLLLMLCTSSLLFAQNTTGGGDNLGDITFEELKDPNKSNPYFAAAGGFVGNFLFINKDNLNSSIRAPYKIKDFSSPMFLSGGQGFAAIGVISNVRVGFTGMAGSQPNTQADTANGVAITHDVDFSASMNGLSIDYAIPVFSRFTILPGVMLGWGTMRLESSKGPTEIEWGTTGATSGFRTDRLEESHYFVQPQLNIEYAIGGFSMIRLNAGYAATFSSDWKENGISVVKNAPSGVNASGLMLGFGIFVGIFN